MEYCSGDGLDKTKCGFLRHFHCVVVVISNIAAGFGCRGIGIDTGDAHARGIHVAVFVWQWHQSWYCYRWDAIGIGVINIGIAIRFVTGIRRGIGAGVGTGMHLGSGS